jgi:ribonuclease G
VAENIAPNRELVINSAGNEINIALLENKRLVEISTEPVNMKFSVGDIYLAKVKKIVSGLNAVFVELGYEKDAFLHYHDLGPQFSSLSLLLNQFLSNKAEPADFSSFSRIPDIDKNGNISDIIASGQQILVQVAKEPISNKGPRLSSEISIAGRNLVLIPFSDKVSVSQKVKSNDEKNRLKKIVQSVRPANYGIIIRTVAVGKSVEELQTEIAELVEKWEAVLVKLKKGRHNTPKLILGELGRVSAMLRDVFNASFSSIHVDTPELYSEVTEFVSSIAPELTNIVKLYEGQLPIYESFSIDKQVRGLFGKNVAMKNGAYLIIEHTEALHVIDVNSGNRTKFEKDQESNAFDVNAIAADEIARQLRLRDMGGIIVVDFIDMKSQENKLALFEKLKTAMLNDRAKHNILPLSRFGLMQITRQRVRPEMNINIKETCPCCNGKGEIAPSINLVDKIEDDVKHIRNVLKVKSFTLNAHPYIAGYITKNFFWSIKRKWQRKHGLKLNVDSRSSFNYLEYNFTDSKNNPIKL